MVYTRLSDVPFRLADLPAMPRPEHVLLTSPDHFSVEYVINPHMAGHVGQTDRTKARQQWETLRAAYERTGLDVDVVEGEAGLPDMVFCANQTLPFVREDGSKGVVLSQMHAEQRRAEVNHFARFFEDEGYKPVPLGLPGTDFEGMGDALWHPGRRLLWGGYGFRTALDAYQRVSALTGAPVLALELLDPEFYHLDTCLSALDEKTALYFPGAFQPEGLEMLNGFWETLIEAPEDEARHLFACNAHCPDGRHVLIQRGWDLTNERLREAGFKPVELETEEYLKSGGSVFCMKLAYW
ncbi:MAG TPA: arginine deiminase-related protein [Rhodothermales bacterium]|nr:arginine deiminase-related protein [Rhodothermales bacterium]